MSENLGAWENEAMKNEYLALVLGSMVSALLVGCSTASTQVSLRKPSLRAADRKIASVIKEVTGGDVGDRPALTHCSLSVSENIPVLRIKLQDGAAAEQIPGSSKLKVPQDKIVSVQKLNPSYFNGDYSGYEGYQESSYVVLFTSVPHPKLEFDVFNECSQDVPDGLCLLKLRKDGKITPGVFSNFNSEDKTLAGEYQVPEGSLSTRAWVEHNKSTGVTEIFAALDVSNDVLKADRTVVEMNSDSANVRLPIGKSPTHALVTVILSGTPSEYKVSPTSQIGPKSDSVLVECH